MTQQLHHPETLQESYVVSPVVVLIVTWSCNKYSNVALDVTVAGSAAVAAFGDVARDVAATF